MADDNSGEIIGILGAGWLGSALVDHLARRGFHVRATRRSAARLEEVPAGGNIERFVVDLPHELPEDFLAGLTALVITIPPRGRQLGVAASQEYLRQLAALRPALSTDPALRIVYCSSVSVYGPGAGEVDEEGPLAPSTDSARAVVAAERLFLSVGKEVYLARLGGLVGPGRHPGRFFGGRGVPITRGEAPVNLVHQHDAVTAIEVLLGEGVKAGAYNICAAAHPTRASFYGAAAGAVCLDVGAVEGGGAGQKIVLSYKLRNCGWLPQYDDLHVFTSPAS